MNVNEKFIPDVYYVQTDSKKGINPIAIRPRISGDIISWEDTSRGTYRKFTQIKEMSNSKENSPTNPEEIVFSTSKGETVTLTKLTKEIYNKSLKTRVAECPNFDSDEAIKTYYLETNFQIY